MSSGFDDLPILHDDDEVGVPDGGEPVGYDEGCPSAGQPVHGSLYVLLRAGVHRTRGLIEDGHVGILHNRPGDGQLLPLTGGESGTVVYHRLILIRQRFYELPYADGLACLHYGGFIDIRAGEGYVLPDGSPEQP